MLKRVLELLLGVLISLVSVLMALVLRRIDLTPPELSVPDTEITYVEGSDTSSLLAGVTATDKRDGDVSDSVCVERVLPISSSEAFVVYAAKDSANNVVKKDRKVRYSTGAE